MHALTLNELAESLRAQAADSLAGDAEAWNELVRLVDDATTDDCSDVLTTNRKWLLRKLSVEGFRGAKHKFDLDLDNPRGITVLFGENGSGKSSLAEAVRVAIEGRTSATHLETTGSGHELWEASIGEVKVSKVQR
nr:ATP-binding protein [Arthrobacter silviterrae]